MVNLEKNGDSAIRFTFTDSDHYLYKDGYIDVPINSLSLVIDESEMVTFKKSATGDPFISFRADNSNLGTKEAIEQFYKGNMVGAGGISQEEVQDMIDSSMSGVPSSQVVEQLRTDVDTLSANTYTKTQIDGFLDNATTMLTTISGAVDTHEADIADLWDTIDEKEEVIASALTEVKQDVNKKASVYYVDFWALFNDSYEMDDAKWNEMVEAYNNNAIFYAIPNDDFNNAAIPLMVEYSAIDNYFWFNVSYGNGYASLSLNRIDGRDGYEYEVSDPTENYINVDDHLDSGSTNPVQNAVITQALDAKADLSAVTAVSNDLNTLSGAVIDNEYTVSQSLNDLNSRKLDASAYTPTDLSQYWTSAQTQSAIDDAKAYYIDFTTLTTQGIHDADWDGMVAAINAHRPIYAGLQGANGLLYYTAECLYQDGNNIIKMTASDNSSHYFYTFTKNGSENYDFSYTTKPYVPDITTAITSGSTDTEIPTAKATYDAIQAGGGGGATYTAGTNIDITNDTINCTLPITADSYNNITIGSGSSSSNQRYNVAIGDGATAGTNGWYGTAIAIGKSASAPTPISIAIGQQANANGGGGIAIGSQASTNITRGVAIGNAANATGTTKMNLNDQIKVDTNNQVYIKDKTNTTDVCIQDAIAALGGLKLVKILQADYDALATKDNDTLFIIPDGDGGSSDWPE